MKTINFFFTIFLILTTTFFTANGQQLQDSSSAKGHALKDKWTKHYNEIKGKLDEYSAKLKKEGTKNSDFDEAVDKLNKMINDYKDKINKWDQATKDQRANYSDELKEDFKRLKAQEDKVKEMWKKMAAKNSSEKKS